MNTLRKAAVVLGAVALAVVTAPTLADAKAQLTEVLVKNTTAEPVPVQAVGTTPVSGAVSVAGPVTTTTPVRWTGTVAVGSSECASFEPPRGHVLVVDQVAVRALQLSASPGYQRPIWLRVGNAPLDVELLHHFTGMGGDTEHTGQVRGPFVVGGPEGLSLSVCTRYGSSGGATAIGHLEPLPA